MPKGPIDRSNFETLASKLENNKAFKPGKHDNQFSQALMYLAFPERDKSRKYRKMEKIIPKITPYTLYYLSAEDYIFRTNLNGAWKLTSKGKDFVRSLEDHIKSYGFVPKK